MHTYSCPQCGRPYESKDCMQGTRFFSFAWPSCPSCCCRLHVSGASFIVLGLFFGCLLLLIAGINVAVGWAVTAAFVSVGLMRVIRRRRAYRRHRKNSHNNGMDPEAPHPSRQAGHLCTVGDHMIDFLQHLFDLEHKANSTLLGALTEEDTDALRIMRHIIEVQLEYLAKYQATQRPRDDSPSWPLATCRQQERAAARAWQDHLAVITEADLDWQLEGHGPTGRYQLGAVDMMMHVITHGVYHRAQIDSALRQSGREPPFVMYVRLARTKIEETES